MQSSGRQCERVESGKKSDEGSDSRAPALIESQALKCVTSSFELHRDQTARLYSKDRVD